MNHVVFADPTNAAARALQADALEQLGYQAESGPWRDFYLTGAQELRNGHPPAVGAAGAGARRRCAAMTTEMLLRLPRRAVERPRGRQPARLPSGWSITDRGEHWHVGVEHGALHHSLAGVLDKAPEATLSVPYLAFAALAGGNQTLDELLDAGEARIDGDRAALDHLVTNLDHFSFGFPIVTP